jgi:hypothetical protein
MRALREKLVAASPENRVFRFLIANFPNDTALSYLPLPTDTVERAQPVKADSDGVIRLRLGG